MNTQLKEQIKQLSEEQKFYKSQRKTVNLVGERKLEPWKASMLHFENRHKLRAMYIALGILQGRENLNEIDKHIYDENYISRSILSNAKKIAEKYAKETVCSN